MTIRQLNIGATIHFSDKKFEVVNKRSHKQGIRYITDFCVSSDVFPERERWISSSRMQTMLDTALRIDND